MKPVFQAALSLALTAGPALAQSALPNPSLTRGAINPAVTQATIGDTICVPDWTRTVRPPERYTEELKRRQIAEYGYTDRRLGDYEEDHLDPLGTRRRAERSAEPLAGATSRGSGLGIAAQGLSRKPANLNNSPE